MTKRDVPQSPVVWLNGIFVPADEAHLPLSDAGLQHGVGLFETMRAANGRLFRADAHLARLDESMRMLGLQPAVSAPGLAQAAQHTMERCGLRESRVRLTVTGGTTNLLSPQRGTSPRLTIAIAAQPMRPYPEAAYVLGIGVQLAEPRISPSDPFVGHKTLNYWPRLAVLQHAGTHGIDEALWLTTDRFLVGATVGNAFIVRDGVVLTPPARRADAPQPTLPGITRAAVIEIARHEGIALREQAVTLPDLHAADEIFLTNSMWGVLPVSRFEHAPVGTGTPGPVARRMRERFTDLLERETRE